MGYGQGTRTQVRLEVIWKDLVLAIINDRVRNMRIRVCNDEDSVPVQWATQGRKQNRASVDLATAEVWIGIVFMGDTPP
jgi:hypothetical protein